MTSNYLNLLTSLALLTSAAAANAAPAAEPAKSEHVGYSDLDLSTWAGQSRLKHRIRVAADDVCIDHNVRGMTEALQAGRCAKAAASNGYAQMRRVLAARSGTAVAAADTAARGE